MSRHPRPALALCRRKLGIVPDDLRRGTNRAAPEMETELSTANLENFVLSERGSALKRDDVKFDHSLRL